MKVEMKRLNGMPKLRDALIALEGDGEQALPRFENMCAFMRSTRGDDEEEPDVVHSVPEGSSAFLNYIIRDQQKNIKNQCLPKGMALIKDSISSHIFLKFRDDNTPITDKTRLSRELLRRITTPTRAARNDAPTLNAPEENLVAFHRDGLLPLAHFSQQERDNKWLDDEYFNKAKNLPIIIAHFVQCLNRQEIQDSNDIEYVTRKRSPLPLFRKGRRISINLDALMLYYIIKHAKALESGNGRNDFSSKEPAWIAAANKFKKDRRTIMKWIHYIFDFARWKDKRPGRGRWRISDDKGIFATTNGVVINVLLRQREFEDETDALLLQNNLMLQLSPYNAAEDSDYNSSSSSLSAQDMDLDQDMDLEDDDYASSSSASLSLEDMDMDLVVEDDEGPQPPRRSQRSSIQTSSCYANVDPGRRNIIYCVILDAGGNFLKRVVLTRAGYYETAMINFVRKRSHHWNQDNDDLRNIGIDFSENHFLTTDNDNLKEAFQTYLVHHHNMWTLRGKKKKWARQGFFLYQRKNAVINRFLDEFSNVTVGEQRYHLEEVRYEDGKFASGRRTERYVP